MNNYKDFIKSIKKHEMLLIVLFIIYIIFDIQTPNYVLSLVNNTLFQTILIIITLSLLLYLNPIISILAIISLFILIHRSKKQLLDMTPSEITKFNNMLNYNNVNKQSSVTLEEDVVNKMAPFIIDDNKDYSFQPIIDNQYNAREVTDSEQLY